MIHIILVSVWYVMMGLITFYDFVTTAGTLVSYKYDCSRKEGIARFVRVDGFWGNARAVTKCVLTWPVVAKGLYSESGISALSEMVAENDY